MPPEPIRDGSAPLLEREEELDALSAAISDATAGRGGVVVVEGPLGAGKTCLLAAARKLAFSSDVHPLVARGGELASDIAFGVVLQLLEPVLFAGEIDRDAAPAAVTDATDLLRVRDASASGGERDPYPVFEALYAVCVALSRRTPVLATIDDAQDADAQSLRFATFLARRVEHLPFALVLAVDQDEPPVDPVALGTLAGDPATTIIRPEALSQDAVSALLAEALATEPGERFAVTCHAMTRGNPLLVQALIEELRHRRIAPADAAVRHLRQIGPRSVGRARLSRIVRRFPEAAPVATAAAVLGDDASFTHVARLAEVSAPAARRAADALVRAGVLRPGRGLTFVHPLVRQAVYEDLGPGERSRLHRGAVDVVSSGDRELAARHLVLTFPEADERVVEALRAGARAALARGAADVAVRYLRRAGEERPPGGPAAVLMAELGEAEFLAGTRQALERLEQAAAVAAPAERARVLRLLALAQHSAGQRDEARASWLSAREQAAAAGDELLAGQIAAEHVAASQLELLGPDAELPSLDEPPADDDRTLAGALVAAARACAGLRALRVPVADAIATLVHLTDRQDLPVESPVVAAAAVALAALDRFDAAEAVADRIGADPRTGTAGYLRATEQALRAHVAYRRGALPHAERSARASVSTAAAAGGPCIPLAAGTLVEILVERNDLEAADAVLRREAPHCLTGGSPSVVYAHARSAAARGDWQAALDGLLESGRQLAAAGTTDPAFCPWRSAAALAYHALGRPGPARSLADGELALARATGVPRATGVALRAAATVGSGCGGNTDGTEVDPLREAVRVLERSRARLEYGRALADLGAAQRRRGRRRDARSALEQARAIASMCGATALEQRCRQELTATGTMSDAVLARGDRDTLTPSERRVAELAAAGRSNQEIARELSISHKTVERHLHSVYHKLGVSSRQDLAPTYRPRTSEP